jgi:hypothetical protein
MDSAVIWDAEFLTAPGAPQRFWCGPDDPDPVLVQIGAVRLGLTADFAIGESLSCVVVPRDRKGDRYPIPEFFAGLTGISARRVADEGVELAEGLARLKAFAAGAPIWAWGTDELNAIAVSCYLAGLAPPIPATRFGNATRLLAAAGVPRDEIHQLRSDRLAAHFGLSHPGARAHDACSDAMSTALALQHLLREGRLRAEAFVLPD